MTSKFSWHEMAGMIALLLALSGLIWTAAQQSGKVDNLEARVVMSENQQDRDHDDIIQLKAGVDFLVQREKERVARGAL